MVVFHSYVSLPEGNPPIFGEKTLEKNRKKWIFQGAHLQMPQAATEASMESACGRSQLDALRASLSV